MLLKDRVAIITGSGKGIGKVAALKLAQEGATVVNVSRTQAEIDRTAEEIRALGGKALAVSADISKPEQVEAMIERTVGELGQIDILINNAAMPGPVKQLVDLDFEDWDFVYGINVRGTMACCKYALRHMIPRRGGSIINISSTVARKGAAGRTHYSSSKTAVVGFTRALAMEAGPHNIRVNCIVPGAVMTELLHNLITRESKEQGITYEERKAVYAGPSPMGRITEPEEVADAMIYLASDLSQGITGQSVDVNSGAWMS